MFSVLLVAHSKNKRKYRSLRMATPNTGLCLSMCNVKSDVIIGSYLALHMDLRLTEKCGTQSYKHHKGLSVAGNWLRLLKI